MTVQLPTAQHFVVFQLRLKHVRLSVNVSVSLIANLFRAFALT